MINTVTPTWTPAVGASAIGCQLAEEIMMKTARGRFWIVWTKVCRAGWRNVADCRDRYWGEPQMEGGHPSRSSTRRLPKWKSLCRFDLSFTLLVWSWTHRDSWELVNGTDFWKSCCSAVENTDSCSWVGLTEPPYLYIQNL